ncbi:MAG: cupin domain-containing protein [Calditrichia bacterium]|nr:cupin domain-containing protein [Calditrichia bacterium]
MTPEKQNIYQLFSTISDYFSPKIIGEVNDVYIKLAKVKGQAVPWHIHKNEDELFYVIKGGLTLELRNDDSVHLDTGELFTVKAGVEHRVHTEEECWLMLIENKSTQHTGDVKAPITKSIDEQNY